MSEQPVCAKCLQGMDCEKNEVFVDCGNGYVKSGDRFRCRRCGAGVIVGFGKIHFRYNMAHDIAKDEQEMQFYEDELANKDNIISDLNEIIRTDERAELKEKQAKTHADLMSTIKTLAQCREDRDAYSTALTNKCMELAALKGEERWPLVEEDGLV